MVHLGNTRRHSNGLALTDDAGLTWLRVVLRGHAAFARHFGLGYGAAYLLNGFKKYMGLEGGFACPISTLCAT